MSPATSSSLALMWSARDFVMLSRAAEQADRQARRSDSIDECAYVDVQADGGAAWLAAPRLTDEECHAGHSDDDGRYVVALNVQYSLDFSVEQLGVFIGVGDRGVVQSRAENIATEGDCVDLA